MRITATSSSISPVYLLGFFLMAALLYSRTEKIVRKLEQVTGGTFHRTETATAADYLQQDRIFTSGNNPKYQHDSWTELHNEVNFYQWLLRFKQE